MLADGLAGATDWVGFATALCGAAGAALGLPPLLASRRARRTRLAAESPGPRLILPSRIQLVDRVDEVRQVLGHLAAGEYVVTLEGSIGVGKSALAMEVAHRLAAGEGARGGRRKPPVAFETLVWMDAANQCPDLVDLARTLSLTTGERSLSAAPAAGKPDAIRSFLSTHPCVGFIIRDGEEIGLPFLNELLRTRDVAQPLEGLQTPLLLVHGDADTEVPVDQSAKAEALVAGPVRRVVVPGGDHCLERPEERAVVDREASAWLAAHL